MKIGKRYLPSRSAYQEAADKQIVRLGITVQEQDAFTHAFSLALAARDWGETAAKTMGSLHEYMRPHNPTDEWLMDRHNNTLGILTGKDKPAGTHDDVIADEIKQRLAKGQLIINPQETGMPHEPWGEPDGGSEEEIIQAAQVRMRNTRRHLPPETPAGEEDKLFKDDIRRKAMARGARLLGAHRYTGAEVVAGIRAFFKKK